MSTFEANCRRVAADIKNNDRCTFDVMLKEFLRRVSSAQSNVEDVDNLMKDVLQAMLPICGEIQGQVMAYCNDQGNTDERKKTFANLVNGALARLDMLDEDAHMFSPYTFQEAETSLLAHLNGVVVADGSDEVKFVQTRAQERDKPGIVLTSLAAALRISGKNFGTCREEYMASGPASQDFTWPDILASFELRRTDNALAPPPDAYTVDCVSNVPPIEDVKEGIPNHAGPRAKSRVDSKCGIFGTTGSRR
ncbi:hypothetical protein OF83DRAFT_1172031 [Amylostereum chailletii]|nr:hypothetical protein OF83DRAFT_1172031 [Amylostereum chailletii]